MTGGRIEFYTWVQPLIGHPERVGPVAVGRAVPALVMRRRHPRPLLIAAAAWALFGVLEAEAVREHAGIRVDLLFTWPALFLGTIVCAGWWLGLASPRRHGLKP